MLSVEIISLVLVALVNLVILLVIATQGWHVKVNRLFAYGVLFVIPWSIGTLLLLAGSSVELVNAGRLLFLIAPMYTILFLSMFASMFPRYYGSSLNWVTTSLTALTIIFSAFIFANPEHFMLFTITQSGFNDIVVDSYWYTVYTVYFNIAFTITFGGFYLNSRSAKGSGRKQLLYIFYGTLLAAGFSLVTNLMMPLFGNAALIWLGPTWSLFYVGTVSVAIIKHQLFDVKLAAVRSAAYTLSLITLAVVYYLAAYLTSSLFIQGEATNTISLSPVNILLALLLVMIFQPIKRFFDRVTDDIFYRGNYNSEEFFASLSKLLSSTIDLRGLLERASKEMSDTFKTEQAMFFLYYTSEVEHHMSAGTRGHARFPLYDARMLDEFVAKADDPLIITELLGDEVIGIKRMLTSHRVALVMPLRREDKIVGYVMLGEKKSGGFSKRDLSVLQATSDELVIAIQNALSLHEVKELNATLQQRINVATRELRSSNAQLKHLDEIKDEFISMASHQLRTPLTGVRGYLSMVLDGDGGNVTPKQQKLLTEAFDSSERMVRLIADFLNVSRLQSGKFIIDKQQVNLTDMVHQEVNNLKVIAGMRHIKFREKILKDDVFINADESKMRQVIMNFIDNAIYYSKPNSTIIINLERVKNDVAFTVVDTGIGVPEADQNKLFNKFYRADNARKKRPDGTGVGLYMARRVIAGHDGSIIFSSREGRGSTFGFRMPAKGEQA